MYPLDEVYGPRAYHTFKKDGAFNKGLKSTLQRSLDIFNEEPLLATSYTDLVEMVSFFSEPDAAVDEKLANLKEIERRIEGDVDGYLKRIDDMY